MSLGLNNFLNGGNYISVIGSQTGDQGRDQKYMVVVVVVMLVLLAFSAYIMISKPQLEEI